MELHLFWLHLEFLHNNGADSRVKTPVVPSSGIRRGAVQGFVVELERELLRSMMFGLEGMLSSSVHCLPNCTGAGWGITFEPGSSFMSLKGLGAPLDIFHWLPTSWGIPGGLVSLRKMGGRFEGVKVVCGLQGRTRRDWEPSNQRMARRAARLTSPAPLDDDDDDGADINTPMNNGATPVFIASQNGHVDALEFLHKNGADINTPRNDGTTPVFIASQNGHLEVVKFLLLLGADICRCDDRGANPVFQASLAGHVEVVMFLHSHGASILTAMSADKFLTDYLTTQGVNIPQ